jgi:hypothetical protein
MIPVGTPTADERLYRFHGGVEHLNERAITKGVGEYLKAQAAFEPESFPKLAAVRPLVRLLCRPTEREEDALWADAKALADYFARVPRQAELARALKEAIASGDTATMALTIVDVLRVEAITYVEAELRDGVEGALTKYLKPARKPRKKPAKKAATRSRATSTAKKGKK